MKIKGIIAILLIAIVAFVVYSVTKTRRFAPAEDFPREALVYVQVADLPAFIKLWNDSSFKEKYTASKGFQNFKNRHLALKLASRWEEFNKTSGFPIDLETVASLSNNQAAVAIYDIGKLDFVFIAPLSDELFTATKFVKNQDNFLETPLQDGTIIYRAVVGADRGRQKQELLFTHVKNRFILATSEKRLMQTLNNINGKQAKNRLVDEPSFKTLIEKSEPHTATVWVDQTRLNKDYYFKRYWLMSSPADLKNIRAGIFDFELQKTNLIERRKFLLDENVDFPAIENSQSEKILSLLPENIPFYQLQKANQKGVDAAVRNIIFDRSAASDEISDNPDIDFSSDNDDDKRSTKDYSDLSEDFDRNINETEEKETIEQRENKTDFSDYLQTANPQLVLTFTKPEVLPAPKFVEFQRAAIFQLSAPKAFDQMAFESAIERSISTQMLAASPNSQLKWTTKTENNLVLRELNLPMLGWGFSYAVRGNELILTNNSALLKKIMLSKNPPQPLETKFPFSELTSVNLAQKENAYDKVFAELVRKKAANSFFMDDVGSFLNSISEIKKLEIRRNYSQNILDEQLTAQFGN